MRAAGPGAGELNPAEAAGLARLAASRWDEAVDRRGAAILARAQSFTDFATTGGFVADREPINLTAWNYLRAIYDAVPANPAGLDLCIMKSAQGGASIFAMLCALWLLLTRRVQLAYFLPTQAHAMAFSGERFLRMAKDNPRIYRSLGTVEEQDEGSKSIRRLGSSLIYFTYMGGKVTTESLPLDGLFFDEVQVMSLTEMETALERIAASALRLVFRLSTANFEGADIHFFYQRSDQREWFTRCGCAEGVVLSDCWDAKAGPLCIGEGNGTTPGIPTEPFWFCPRCSKRILDVRDGVFRPRNPGVSRVGFHFPQFLSPRWSAASTLEAWRDRVDTKNFYNRKLGLPYTDPDTQPITPEVLGACVDRTLAWCAGDVGFDAVFMGVDQMGRDNRVLIAAPWNGKMRLLHAEIVQGADPFRRCGQLMREFNVTVCAVEALPNYNDAHRFAQDFDGKVFVVHYQDLVEQLVLWGDRPREKVTVRRTADEAKDRYTAVVDQYKAMAWALGRWVEGAVVTPDERTLVQPMRDERGKEVVVAVLRDQVWLHLQRVALVTEPIQGREDERKYRRAVRKVGIDPHFAYTWMLLCVAWTRRYGTEFMLAVDRDPAAIPGDPARRPTGDGDQVRRAFPALTETPRARAAEGGPPPDTCGSCQHFRRADDFCTLRRLVVTATLPACDGYLGGDDPEDVA